MKLTESVQKAAGLSNERQPGNVMAYSDAQSNGQLELAAAVTHHARWLRTVIAARLGEADAVDDILQEVRLAAVEQRAPVRDAVAVKGWLYQVAVRQVMQHRRKRGRERRRLASVARSDESENGHGDPLAYLMTSERQELVREALQRLNDDERELLFLKYLEGWSYQQISECTGRTERSVESQLHRIRRAMRSALTRSGVVDDGRPP